jgi:hypothetical protein
LIVAGGPARTETFPPLTPAIPTRPPLASDTCNILPRDIGVTLYSTSPTLTFAGADWEYAAGTVVTSNMIVNVLLRRNILQYLLNSMSLAFSVAQSG